MALTARNTALACAQMIVEADRSARSSRGTMPDAASTRLGLG
jgi:hypothetical protein